MIIILILLRQTSFFLTRITSNILNYKNSRKNVRQTCYKYYLFETDRANSEILNVLKDGYKLPFLESPSESFSNNNASALKDMEFVDESVPELVQN